MSKVENFDTEKDPAIQNPVAKSRVKILTDSIKQKTQEVLDYGIAGLIPNLIATLCASTQ